MIVLLLELRYGTMRDTFLAARSNQQISKAWDRLALRFNSAANLEYSVPMISLKNKIYDLRKRYMALRVEDNATGNSSDETSEKPPFRPEMVAAFGDMRGLGETEFGVEQVAANSGVDETNSSSDEVFVEDKNK
ncbi:hypothetical protein AC1031_020803 [Aphanomyces cochlioides]|nr:hypothetical protein AC1031_020803 [Aphanomyces cochlioides]